MGQADAGDLQVLGAGCSRTAIPDHDSRACVFSLAIELETSLRLG